MISISTPGLLCCVHQMESAVPGRSLRGHGGVTRSDAACPRSSSTHISALPAVPQDTALLTCASTKPMYSRVSAYAAQQHQQLQICLGL